MAVDSSMLAAEVPGLLRYGRTLSRRPEQVEDLVQSTLLRALERGNSYRGDAALGTWLRRILHNIAVDDGRSDRERPAGNLLLEAADEQGPEVDAMWADASYTVDAATVVERSETKEELEDGLARLPVIYRSAVVLHDAEGFTVAEIAQIHDIGLPAAKQRLRRGRMMLVSALAAGPERRVELRGVPMRCWDARLNISDYLDDELPTAGRRLLEQHLRSCPTCPPLYAGVVGVRAAMGGLRDPDTVIPPGLASRIAAVLDR